MRFASLLAIFLIPLLITPGLFVYFDTTPKIIVLLFCVSAMLCFRKENVNAMRALLGVPLGRWFAGLLAIEFLVTLVCSLASTNRALSINGGSWRRWGWITDSALLVFMVLVAGWMAVDRRRITSILRASVAAGLVASTYGICQYFGWDPFIPIANYQAGEGPFLIVRPPGTIGHADYFASWLLIVVFFALALSRVEKNNFLKVVSVGTASLSSLAILLSGTRAAMLGLICGVVILLALQRFRMKRQIAAFICGLVVLTGGLVASPAGAKLRARLHWAIEDARGGSRVFLWRDSARMAALRPWTGFGPETFTTVFPRYASIDLVRAYPDFYQESPHNIFLDSLISRGLPGLATLAAFIVLAVLAGRRALRMRDRAAGPLLAGLAAFVIAQQFSVMVVATAFYFYLLIAILAVLAMPAAPPMQRKYGAGLFIPIPALALLFVAFGLRITVSDHALAAAEACLDSGAVDAAAAAYRTALHWQPNGSGSDLAYSRAMARLASRSPVFAVRLRAWQQAMEAGTRATATAEDRQNAWYNLATLFAAQNDPVSVERCLRKAIECAPNWFKPHWTLAQILEATGRRRDAQTEAFTALRCDGGHDPEVTATWKAMQGP